MAWGAKGSNSFSGVSGLGSSSGYLSDEQAVARGVSPNTKSPDMGGAYTYSSGLKTGAPIYDGGNSDSTPGSYSGTDTGQSIAPALAPLPSATSSISYDLFRPTDYGMGWNPSDYAFQLAANPNAMNAFVSGQFRGSPAEYFAQFGGAPGAPPPMSAYQTPEIPGLPEAPQQGGANPFYAAREMGGQDYIAPTPAPSGLMGGPPQRMGAPTSRVVAEPITGLGSMDTWQSDWQNRYEAEEARRGEGAREAGYFGPTPEEYAAQVAQARGISDPSVLLDTLAGRLDNYGPETVADFGAIQRMQSSAPQSGWQVGGSTTTTRTPSYGGADGRTLQWNESTSTNPFSANFDPASFGSINSRQDLFGQQAQQAGAPDWSDMLVRNALGEQAFNDFTSYERPFDPGFSGFEPTFEILNQEKDRLQPAFAQNQRLQEAYNNMTSANENAGLLPEGYTMPDFRRVDGQTNANAAAMGSGQALLGENVPMVNDDWLQGTYNPRQGEVTGVYDPRRTGGLGGLGGMG